MTKNTASSDLPHANNADSANKEFVKLTADQLLAVLQWIPMLDNILATIRSKLVQQPSRLDEIAPEGVSWAHYYEESIEHHLAQLFVLMNEHETLIAVSEMHDPQQILLDCIANDEDDGHLLSGGASIEQQEQFPQMFEAYLAILASFECLTIYGSYIHELVARARTHDPQGDKALLQAIRIDPSVASGPTAAKRIARAVLLDEGAFLRDVGLALEGKTGNQANYLRKLRLSLKLLSESGALHGSEVALARKLVELEIYEPGPTAVKNASELIRKFKNINAI